MITIFTPTYNRLSKLKHLYSSLCNQTCKSFKWLVIDDGSTDHTQEFIYSKIKESKFEIKYIYQENSGKHVAYNNALDLMDSNSWHVCVDSDDFLTDDAVEIFYQDIKTIDLDYSLIGIVYPRNMGDESWITANLYNICIPDLKFIHHLNLETVILFRPKTFTNLRFPKFKNEVFLSEESIYIDLISRGYFRFKPKYLYSAVYQKDGLTNSLFTLWVSNYNGTMYTLYKRYSYISNYLFGINKVKEKIKCLLNIGAVNISARKNYLKYTPSLLLSILLSPLILIWKIVRF